MRVVISSGHGLLVRGASGIIDEVDEARLVVDTVLAILLKMGVQAVAFHDNTSTTQEENLNLIVDFHNSQERDLDVSVHFNASSPTSDPRGTECLYKTQESLAADVAAAIAVEGQLINRGSKYRDDLFFLNSTDRPAILIEVCFVDSEADVEAYQANMEEISLAIARVLRGKTGTMALFRTRGKCSWFGGPDDLGVSPDEGLAFFYDFNDAPHLFLDEQPDGTTGLARRLNPGVNYVACRWDYDITPKEMLAEPRPALVKAGKRSFLAWPADWGPHESTGRIADLSPALMDALDLDTDDEVEVIYPAPKPRRRLHD